MDQKKTTLKEDLAIQSDLNVIGDSAGNFLTAQALVKQMPGKQTLFLGDLNDRGPRSKELIQWIMDTPELDSTHSNHGEMFTDMYKRVTQHPHHPRYEAEIFLMNGGVATVTSYGMEGSIVEAIAKIPKEHIDWLDSRPMYRYTDDFFFSHAPIMAGRSLEQISSLGDGFYPYVDQISRGNLLWNRYPLEGFNDEIGPKINVYGHNSRSKPMVFCHQYRNGKKISSNDEFKKVLDDNKGKVYGICLDTSPSGILTGLHIPTMTIYQQPFLDYAGTIDTKDMLEDLKEKYNKGEQNV